MKIPFFSGSLPALKGPEDRMTLRDHLAELRVRIVRSMLAVTLGVIRDEKLVATSVLNMVRKARRTGLEQAGHIEVPRGPIGEGTRQLSAKATYFKNHDATFVVFTDESEAEGRVLLNKMIKQQAT